MSIRREEIRLKRIFGAAIVAAIPSLAVGACSSSSVATSFADASDDARIDTSPADTRATDAEIAAETTDGTCAIAITLIDSGIDGDAYADPGCSYVNSCGLPSGVVTVGCQVYIQSGEQPDVIMPNGCWVVEDGCEKDVYVPDAPFVMLCPDCTSSGRSTAGIAARHARHSHEAIGAFFAAMARAEGESVIAFDTLARELAHHGAPRSLLCGAARAKRDETRHARILGDLAMAHGAFTPRVRWARKKPRTLLAIARENAVEGTTRETFGALLMHARARLTTDATLARVFARIAADETRHAALSFEIATWMDAKLTKAARAKVKRARAHAMETLEKAVRTRSPSAHDARLGYPRPAEARALASTVRELLA